MSDFIGLKIFNLAKKLWPINRSISGEGLRETLNILKNFIPELVIREVPTGTKVFNWVVPREWRVRDAYIITPNGQKICDFKKNNLHLVGYSIPIKATLNLSELQAHLYSLPKQASAIPFVTSYYKESWGFCLSQDERDKLLEGEYKVFIDSELFEGNLTYGELIIKGSEDKEIFLSTYIDHPSMANDNLSGTTVTTYIAKWLTERGNNRYTYRFVFIPETIGSIIYLSRNLDHLKKSIIAGFNVTCIGDNRCYSFLPTRRGNTLSDSIAKHVLKHIDPKFKSYKWTDRGSDERQYCAPGIDLPVASILRSKYAEYAEYHTSLDDLTNVVTPEGLGGGYLALKKAIEALEKNFYPKVTVLGEPQLGKLGLYQNISTKSSMNSSQRRMLMDVITWSDGSNSLLEIAELCETPIWNLYSIVEKLIENKLLISTKDD